MSSLVSAYHLHAVFLPELVTSRVNAAVEVLRPVAPDVLVVTGLSGILLGQLVAQRLGCHLAVVRREGEVNNTHSGSAHPVEGYLGGRWVFFDDLVASGNTMRFAKDTYRTECAGFGIAETFAGMYLHADNKFYPSGTL